MAMGLARTTIMRVPEPQKEKLTLIPRTDQTCYTTRSLPPLGQPCKKNLSSLENYKKTPRSQYKPSISYNVHSATVHDLTKGQGSTSRMVLLLSLGRTPHKLARSSAYTARARSHI